MDKLGPSDYGDDHPLIGVPCLYDNLPAIPYGSYEAVTTAEYTSERPKQQLLVIQRIYGGKVVTLSGVRVEQLIPIDRHTPQGRKIFHQILIGLANQNK